MPPRITLRLDDVCFVHWPVEATDVAEHLPEPFEPAIRDGSAWLSVLGIAVRPRELPARQSYGQLNVRTYVDPPPDAEAVPSQPETDGPLVYFLDMVIDSALGAAGGAGLFGYPARYGGVSVERTATGVVVEYDPLFGDGFSVRLLPEKPPATAEPGSVEAWLTERYEYVRTDGERDHVEHEPWRLQAARGTVLDDSLPRTFASLPDEPLLQYSPGTVVRA